MPLNTTKNDIPLAESTKGLPRSTLAEDAPFEFHIRYRFLTNSIVNFLKGVRDPYIHGHNFFLLRSNLCLMVEVRNAAAYLQENEHRGPPIFV